MTAITTEFPERTIAQVITVMRVFCRTTGKIPRVVALVEGTSAEPIAWRKVAVDYLTAKAQNRNVNFAGQPVSKGEDNASANYDFASECDSDRS